MTLRLQSPSDDLFAQRGVNEKGLDVELVVALHERILINAIRDGHAIQHLKHQIFTQALCPCKRRGDIRLFYELRMAPVKVEKFPVGLPKNGLLESLS